MAFAQTEEAVLLPVAVAMLPGTRDRAAIASATLDLLQMHFCDNVSQAEQLVVERRAVALFTLHHDAGGTPACDLINRLRRRFPHLSIVVIESCPLQESSPFDAFAAGANAVLRGHHQQLQGHVRATVEHELRRQCCAEFGDRFAHLVADAIRDVVRSAIALGDRPRSVRELAASIGIPRKDLDRRLFQAAVPSAEQLLCWGRLFAIAKCLENPSVSAADVAEDLRFGSSCAVRNLLKRYTGMTPTELRSAGCTEYLFASLRTAMTARCDRRKVRQKGEFAGLNSS